MSAPTPLQIARPAGGGAFPVDPVRAAIRVILPHHTIGVVKPAVVARAELDGCVVREIVLTRRPGDDSTALQCFDAFTELYAAAEELDRPLVVYIGDNDARLLLAEHAGMFLQAVFADSLCCPAGATVRGVYEAAAGLVDDVRDRVDEHRKHEKNRRRQQRVAIYTDGSVSSKRRGCGMGIATTDGVVDAAADIHAPNVPILAELLAIDMALHRFPVQRLTIHTDSQDAIGLIEHFRKTGARSARRFGDAHTEFTITNVVRRIAERCEGRTVKLVWVRGHAGNVYNDAADRAARTVRRAYSYGIARGAVRDVLSRIHDDITAPATAVAA